MKGERSMKYVTPKEVIESFELQIISGREGLDRKIQVSDISRPGLEMAGYFTHYPESRVQLLGKTELSFFELLSIEHKQERMFQLCSPKTPIIIVSHNMPVPIQLIEASNKNHVPVCVTKMSTTRFSGLLTNFLESKLAPTTNVHGVLMDIYGIGVLVTGKSGIGKSETALELVKRGHRLVADDNVEIRQEGENILIGKAPNLIEHLLEIRGIGIINIMTLFGASAVKSQKRISLVIELESWNEEKQYDRLGLDEEFTQIMDSSIHKLTIPVRPGRNLSVIIEVAAMNYRMKRMGVNTAEQFSQQLSDEIEQNN